MGWRQQGLTSTPPNTQEHARRNNFLRGPDSSDRRSRVPCLLDRDRSRTMLGRTSRSSTPRHLTDSVPWSESLGSRLGRRDATVVHRSRPHRRPLAPVKDTRFTLCSERVSGLGSPHAVPVADSSGTWRSLRGCRDPVSPRASTPARDQHVFPSPPTAPTPRFAGTTTSPTLTRTSRRSSPCTARMARGLCRGRTTTHPHSPAGSRPRYTESRGTETAGLREVPRRIWVSQPS